MTRPGASQKLKTFISYSRRDSSDFADELVAGLELAGFAPFLDRHDIAAGEDWEVRLGGLIQEADTVVFVVSPEAVKSERCSWEVDKTLALSKRLLPVFFKAVPETDIPEKLRRLQFVRFDTGTGVTRPLAQLAEALRQDLDWIREHTRLGELAARWQARSRPTSLLLSGDELDAAKAWTAERKPDAPEITDLQRALLKASEEADAARIAESTAARGRTRRMRAVVGVLVIGCVAVVVAWQNEPWLKKRYYWLTSVWPHVLSVEAERALKPGETFKECADCPEIVVVPAGEFMMGSPNDRGGEYERPQHRVTIAKPFAVSKFELTFDQWDACVAHNGCIAARDNGFGRGTRPVINVSWEDAQQYVAWLSELTGRRYRLLSEAEWEYAARAETQTNYSWGNAIGRANANCHGCGSQWDNEQTAPVGSFAANKFGLHDMHGNAWEWVQDCFQSTYNGAPTDGSALTTRDCYARVIRGGSWIDRSEVLRAANRSVHGFASRGIYLGFRVGRTLK